MRHILLCFCISIQLLGSSSKASECEKRSDLIPLDSFPHEEINPKSMAFLTQLVPYVASFSEVRSLNIGLDDPVTLCWYRPPGVQDGKCFFAFLGTRKKGYRHVLQEVCSYMGEYRDNPPKYYSLYLFDVNGDGIYEILDFERIDGMEKLFSFWGYRKDMGFFVNYDLFANLTPQEFLESRNKSKIDLSNQGGYSSFMVKGSKKILKP